MRPATARPLRRRGCPSLECCSPRSSSAQTLVGGGLVASCGEEGSDPVPQTDGPQYGVRDSAGISIAENPRLAPDSRLGWRVGTEPLVSIGTPEAVPDFQFHKVEDATRLADGRIAVANGGSMELLVFDATGQYLASWGGQGEGPGEFAGLNRVRPWAHRLIDRGRPRARAGSPSSTWRAITAGPSHCAAGVGITRWWRVGLRPSRE